MSPKHHPGEKQAPKDHAMITPKNHADGDPLWYRDAIIYELRVRSFYDSDSDGIGDLRGLTEKLDYLQDLGVTTLWLLPFNPSPFRDDGYDISDHTGVDPACGTLQDLKVFLREAHKRDLRVVTELVLNHTSDQHPWFQRARLAPPGSRERDFYVWSETPDRYAQTRIIFSDFETSNWTWDPVAKAYFWHRFYSHQPDLNYDSPDVRKAIFQAVDFWLGMGVDGFRLDAVPYLYEREGTACENLPETHAFLKELRRHVDRKYPERLLLAEANLWPDEAVAYFGEGDECHMAFHFPIMPRLFMALRMEDRFPISDILAQTPRIPDSCRWALFLRNHDELTLETVTDEERDFMYRFYAQDAQARINLGIRRRLAPLLGNARRRIELMNALLFTLPGTPVIYYGDEIGMGDNIYLGDRNGVRTPMQWSGDRNAGFSRANPQRLLLPVITDPEYHYETVNVEAQQNNLQSLLWWMKRLIAMRKRYRALSRGTIQFLHPANRKVLAFVRSWEDEHVLVVANLSRFPQYVELDLSPFHGLVAVETFGRTEFPPIGEAPYLLTLGPHAFYWFALESKAARQAIDLTTRGGDGFGEMELDEARVGDGGPGDGRPGDAARRSLPTLSVRGSWESVVEGTSRQRLEELLPGHLIGQPWFQGRERAIKAVRIVDRAWLPAAAGTGRAEGQPPDAGDVSAPLLAFVGVEYSDGGVETYVMGLAFASEERVEEVLRTSPQAAIADLHTRNSEHRGRGLLYDALHEESVWRGLLDLVSRGRSVRTRAGELAGTADPAFQKLRGNKVPLAASTLQPDSGRASILFGDRFTFRLFRRLPEGPSPELEIGRFLAATNSVSAALSVIGWVDYRIGEGEPATLGILQEHVASRGDAWGFTVREVERYFERALTRQTPPDEVPVPVGSPVELSLVEPSPHALDLIGAYLEAARLLGRRTAALHLALGSAGEDPSFTPEEFSPHYQRSLYQSLRTLAARVFQRLRERASTKPHGGLPNPEEITRLEEGVHAAFQRIRERPLTGQRIRCHGSYDLTQVLHTGGDFLVGFAGEPVRGLFGSRSKRSPLTDVSGMLRSFHAAAWTCLTAEGSPILARPGDIPALEPWARFWHGWVGAVYLAAYLEDARRGSFLPSSLEELDLLVRTFLLEASLLDLERELELGRGRERIPLIAIREWIDLDRRSGLGAVATPETVASNEPLTTATD
jgi:maltose alpha-D-glucosyltransferase/alpha-amylase